MGTSPGAAAGITLDTYEDVRAALLNKELSRTFDTRTFEEGNIREGVVSTAHGALHRARRRLENSQFRPDVLRRYEFELFPPIVDGLLDALIDRGSVDLVRLGGLLSVVLAARRVGVDVDWRSLDRLDLLARYVDGLAQMSRILDSRDPDETRRLARKVLSDWERDFVGPSWRRRSRLIERHGPDWPALPNDLLTSLLIHRLDPELELRDDGRVVRELATYLVGGATATSGSLVKVIDLLLAAAERDPSLRSRVVDDPAFAQRCVHETLRLRPNTPRPRRHAEAATNAGSHRVAPGTVVVLDVASANADPGVFGATAEAFDPDRRVPDGVPRWGLSFGAGPHQCPGRTVAGGFPVPDDGELGPDHLFGLVALMLQAVMRRGVARDPAHSPVPDTRTERAPNWLHYPVVFRTDRSTDDPVGLAHVPTAPLSTGHAPGPGEARRTVP